MLRLDFGTGCANGLFANSMDSSDGRGMDRCNKVATNVEQSYAPGQGRDLAVEDLEEYFVHGLRIISPPDSASEATLMKDLQEGVDPACLVARPANSKAWELIDGETFAGLTTLGNGDGTVLLSSSAGDMRVVVKQLAMDAPQVCEVVLAVGSHPLFLLPVAQIHMSPVPKVGSVFAYPYCAHGSLAQWAEERRAAGHPPKASDVARIIGAALVAGRKLLSAGISPASLTPTELFLVDRDGLLVPRLRLGHTPLSKPLSEPLSEPLSVSKALSKPLSEPLTGPLSEPPVSDALLGELQLVYSAGLLVASFGIDGDADLINLSCACLAPPAERPSLRELFSRLHAISEGGCFMPPGLR